VSVVERYTSSEACILAHFFLRVFNSFYRFHHHSVTQNLAQITKFQRKEIVLRLLKILTSGTFDSEE
jgi:hypothetical protein